MRVDFKDHSEFCDWKVPGDECDCSGEGYQRQPLKLLGKIKRVWAWINQENTGVLIVSMLVVVLLVVLYLVTPVSAHL